MPKSEKTEPEWLTAERQLKASENWVHIPRARATGGDNKYVRSYGLDGALYPRIVLSVEQHYDGAYEIGAAKKRGQRIGGKHAVCQRCFCQTWRC